MIQEVKFQGLSHSPSDYEAQDGELATCLNLINEDGSLHPIPQPVPTNDNITISSSESIRFVHKVTHSSDIHSHYIIYDSVHDEWSWIESTATTNNRKSFGMEGFQVNSVCAIGNILCFVGNESTMYAFWNNDKYTIFNNSIFKYDVSITSKLYVDDRQTKTNQVTVNFQDDWDDIWKSNGRYSNTSGNAKNAKASQIVFNGIDAYINKMIEENDEYTFKYLSFGVVAVKLYDGTYTNISMPFVLAPAFISNKFLWSDSSKAIRTLFNMHAHSITVSMDIPSELSELIAGVDVFLSSPQSFLDMDERFHTIANSWNSMHNEKMDSGVYSFAMNFIDSNKIYEVIDNLVFYKSVTIDRKKLNHEIKLKRISEANESITLSDFNKSSYGGKISYCYNNRLHIADTKKSLNNAFSSYFSDDYNLYVAGERTSNQYDTLLNNRLSLAPEDKHLKFYSCDAVMEVYITENNIQHIVYEKCKIQYPISPIIAYPNIHANRIVMYISDGGHYYKKDMQLHQSNTMGMAYYINLGTQRQTPSVVGSGADSDNSFGTVTTPVDTSKYQSPTDKTMLLPDDMNIPTFIQDDYHTLSEKSYTSTIGDKTETHTYYQWNDDFSISSGYLTMSSKEEFDKAVSNAESSDKFISSNPSLIKVSEAENPLVFPAANSVQVGSSKVKALAANTRPISEGQFGEAPLYAFTDEGVWALMLGTDGTYQARQPINRYICSNPDAILQIDDAVLFPTEHGIMMLQGSESICITDQLDGYPFDFTQLYKTEYAKKVLAINNTDTAKVRYSNFRKYLYNNVGDAQANMVYDYYDNRLVLFNPDYPYAYVYSFKSKQWGTMESNFRERINTYPEAYVINEEGEIVDFYDNDPKSDVPYFLCSRPLSLGLQEIHKTMFSCVTRGYFRDAASGKCGLVLYGSNDLFHWFPIKTSVHKYLRGMAGSPYKYFRIALVGSLSQDESISGLSCEFQERWQNKLR